MIEQGYYKLFNTKEEMFQFCNSITLFTNVKFISPGYYYIYAYRDRYDDLIGNSQTARERYSELAEDFNEAANYLEKDNNEREACIYK